MTYCAQRRSGCQCILTPEVEKVEATYSSGSYTRNKVTRPQILICSKVRVESCPDGVFRSQWLMPRENRTNVGKFVLTCAHNSHKVPGQHYEINPFCTPPSLVLFSLGGKRWGGGEVMERNSTQAQSLPKPVYFKIDRRCIYTE